MTAWLLDANVLIALTTRSHVDHERAHAWFRSHENAFATCPITQGALIRFCMRFGTDKSAAAAWRVLASLVASDRHRFIGDDIAYGDVATTGLIGHSQVTDAYLAALARHHGLRLATLDRGMAQLHADIAELIGA
jgi:toxin-antitoxin system PIN domain toxin